MVLSLKTFCYTVSLTPIRSWNVKSISNKAGLATPFFSLFSSSLFRASYLSNKITNVKKILYEYSVKNQWHPVKFDQTE